MRPSEAFMSPPQTANKRNVNFFFGIHSDIYTNILNIKLICVNDYFY